MLYVLKTTGKRVNPLLFQQAMMYAAVLDETDPDAMKILKYLIPRSSNNPILLSKLVSIWIYYTHDTPVFGKLFTVISKIPKAKIAAPAAAPTEQHILGIADQVGHLYLKSMQRGPLDQNPVARDTLLRLLRSIAT
jgi:hypothetical protein